MVIILAFPISRFSIKFQALENIQLPKYAGSTLRGAFGHALKNIACLTAARNQGVCCCSPVESCLYRQLFDPAPKVLSYQDRTKRQTIAPPFVIEAHALATTLLKDEISTFYMVLIGEFAHQQKIMIEFAWQRALAEGIGVNLSKGSAQSKLISITLCDQPSSKATMYSTIDVEFLTHTRLQHHGKFLEAKDFNVSIFLNAILRRYLSLVEAYSDLKINIKEIQDLYKNSAQIIGSAQLEWVNWSRYSNRQKQKMNLDGFVGTVRLHHINEQLLHYLYLGQWLHVGKGCVFGLGHYVLTAQEHAIDRHPIKRQQMKTLESE